jgi:hypothetical protein
MEKVSDGESLSLLRGRAMRNGALVFCAYLLIMAINAAVEPVASRRSYLMLFPSSVFPWIPTTVVLVLNLAFYGYLVWFFITLIRASQCLEERVVIAAFAASFGFGLLTNLASRAAIATAQYGDIGVWAIATAAAARVVVRHRDEPDVEDVTQPAIERGSLTTAALFVGETLLATAGAILAVGIALRLLYPTAHALLPTITKESFTALNFLPYFPLQIAAGFSLGFLTALHFKSRSVLFVWIVPFVITVLYFCTYEPASVFQNRWLSALSRLFGKSCRPPDCYDQAVVVAPLFAAVAYSFGSWFRVRNSARPPVSASG